MFERFNSFTFFPAQHWSHAWERQHELIYRFAEVINHKIYILPPLGLVDYNIFSIEFFKKVLYRLKKSKSKNNFNKTLDNMVFVKIPYIHKFDSISTSINYAILKSSINISDKNFFWSTYINPVNYLIFKNSAFKIIDLAERRQANNQISKSMKELEKKAVAEADLVIVDNMATFNDYKHLNPNIRYIPQGYDPKQIAYNVHKKGNFIGYIGHLHKHIDYDYLFELIEINKDLEFLIVGGVLDNRANKLKSFKNVTMTGQVPKDDLQKYLEKMRFGLIPYKVNEFTKGVFPTKLFEYLGAGVPVISTPIPEVVAYQNDKYIFIDNKPNKIEYEPDLRGLQDFLAENTWECRFKQYIGSIKEVLK